MLVNNGYDVCHNNCLTCNIVVNRHALPDRPVHSDTNSASLGSIGSECHLSNGCLTLTPPGCQSRTMCAQCVNLIMQDQSHCQLKLSGMREGDMAKQPIMINQKAANLAILSYLLSSRFAHHIFS